MDQAATMIRQVWEDIEMVQRQPWGPPYFPPKDTQPPSAPAPAPPTVTKQVPLGKAGAGHPLSGIGARIGSPPPKVAASGEVNDENKRKQEGSDNAVAKVHRKPPPGHAPPHKPVEAYSVTTTDQSIKALLIKARAMTTASTLSRQNSRLATKKTQARLEHPKLLSKLKQYNSQRNSTPFSQRHIQDQSASRIYIPANAEEARTA